MITPIICGAWDGCHVWIEWDGGPATVEFSSLDEDQIHFYRKIESGKNWIHVPVHEAAKSRIMAKVSIGDEIAAAEEAEFDRAECDFQITAGTAPLDFPKGVMFVRPVDGAVCGYKLLEPLKLDAGATVKLTLNAVQVNPWAHLDNPGDFQLEIGRAHV